MEIMIFCGKGGVGKTTSSVSSALCFSRFYKTCILDYDGGHSVSGTLRIDNTKTNQIFQVEGNLFIGIVESVDFQRISAFDGKNRSLEYLDQFPDDFGIVAFSDMVNEFFGIPVDLASVQKFILLVRMISEAKEMGIEKLVIDVEPTAGLERLLLNSESMLRSLRNLKTKNKILLAAISFTWPDISKFLQSGYIANIDIYTNKIEFAVEKIVGAKYVLVCTPERSPVNQSFEVRKIVENFGGSIYGYVVNNIRGEAHEIEQIKTVEDQGFQTVKIGRLSDMQNQNPREALLSVGYKISKMF